MTILRTVKERYPVTQLREDGSFLVHRPFPTRTLLQVDPFLLFDEMGPEVLGPGAMLATSEAPQRGFETITYLLGGELEHKDIAGAASTLKPGCVHWLTAGQGLLQAQMPSAEFCAKGGRLHGFHLWVNLPRQHKLTKPRSVDLRPSQIPAVPLPRMQGEVRVVSGNFCGFVGPVHTLAPITFLDVVLKPRGKLVMPLAADLNSLLYLFDGDLRLSGDPVTDRGQRLLRLSDVGDDLEVTSKGGGRFLILAGRPLNEPVARYGTVVMNTYAEVEAALEEVHSGRLGRPLTI